MIPKRKPLFPPSLLLGAAVSDVVDGSLRKLTKVDVCLPPPRNHKTKPTSASNPAAAPHGASQHVARNANVSSQKRVDAVDQSLPSLTSVDVRLPQSRNDKTNPPRPLPPRQLAGARLIASGIPVTSVAAKLGVTRQAVWKWHTSERFRAEVMRLHERLNAQTALRQMSS
jgi:hypothetical protein